MAYDFEVQHELVSAGHDIKERSDGWRDLCRSTGVELAETVGLGLLAVIGALL